MNFKKIISSALVFVMLFGAMISALPAVAFAAEEDDEIKVNVAQKNIIDDPDVIKEIAENYLKYNFATAQEMLDYEMGLGYLDSLEYGDYAIYVNRYTGFVYYVNNVTGQILTSNPIDPRYQSETQSLEAIKMSQVELRYCNLTNTSEGGTYNSLEWIIKGSLMKVLAGDNSIDVEYILGPASDAFIAPAVMLLATANELIFNPMFDKFAAMMQDYCGDFDENIARNNGLSITSYSAMEQDIFYNGSYDRSKLEAVFGAYLSYAKICGDDEDSEYQALNTLYKHFQDGILRKYTVITPERANDAQKGVIGALGEGKSVLALSAIMQLSNLAAKDYSAINAGVKQINPSFTLDMVDECENAAGYNPSAEVSLPAFRCTLRYSLSESGEFVLDVPANLIDFDEENYIVEHITPLKYFGAGDMDTDGYVFYPDGSGAIVEFEDFYYGSTSGKTNNPISMESAVYGADYCYSKITGAHREQLTMPIYGMISDVNANGIGYSAATDSAKIKNGFFAIIEEGSSLTKIGYESGGGKYISAYAKLLPYPSDTIDLSQTLSVGNLGNYLAIADTKYTDSYKIKYTMLVDEDVYAFAKLGDTSFNGYVSDYVGMANCYRDYLEANGVIEFLEKSYSDLPLYIEALGSIDVTKKILSFPVNVSTPLTTFDDIAIMYRELSNASATLLERAAEYDKVADELEAEGLAKSADEIDRNRELAEQCRTLSDKVVDIKNINFRLTGFANGGMHFTYPAKLKWEKSVGGKRDFKELLRVADAESQKDGQNFGVYPDFDFMYINNTSAFDGVGRKGTAACMVDNRYASKQTYSSISQEFETIFALLVSSDSLDKLYNKFNKKFSKYDEYSSLGLSVSSLASDLNSNFDEDNPIHRETSLDNVVAILDKMDQSYSLMSDIGNVYAIEFMDHVLNAPLDSSHLNYSSYAIPFYGLVFHGYVNYAGTPLNYSGSPDYEILRAIENGASIYYILCCENTNYLKDDPLLSKYYGVDYYNWYNKILEQYNKLNSAISDLQLYKIVDHTTLLSERIIGADEMSANYQRLIDEFYIEIDKVISNNIDKKLKEMRDEAKIGVGLVFEVSDTDLNAIVERAADYINLSADDLDELYDFVAGLSSIFAKYSAQYSEGGERATVVADDINYKSQYSYVTDSFATDEHYVHTDFTCDNGNVTMVTYEKDIDGVTDTVVFVLNYNVFSVKIKVDETIHPDIADFVDEDGYITIAPNEYVRISK